MAIDSGCYNGTVTDLDYLSIVGFRVTFKGGDGFTIFILSFD